MLFKISCKDALTIPLYKFKCSDQIKHGAFVEIREIKTAKYARQNIETKIEYEIHD